jgi:hypothetical protein
MEIEITNYELLLKRVDYIKALDSFESHINKDNSTPAQIIIQPCDFATDAQIALLFEILQEQSINYDKIKTIHFIPLASFAELFIVEILKTYIASHYFSRSVNTASKSTLWLVEHKHMFSLDNFSNYIQAAASTFGTYKSNLEQCLISDNWLANFVTLRAHLRKTYSDKIEKERWDFNKSCTICGMTTQFDGRGIHFDSIIRKTGKWECNICNPNFRIKWIPAPRFDIM